MKKKEINLLEIAGLFYCFAIAFAPSTGELIVKVARLFLVSSFIIDIIKSKTIKKNISKYTIWIIVLFCYMSMTLIWTIYRENVLNQLFTILYIIICNVILIYSIRKNWNFVYKMMTAGIIGSIAHGLNLYLTNGFGIYLNSRGGEIIENANVLAFVSSFSVLFSFIIIKANKTNNKPLFTVFAIINLIFSILTGSKKIFIFYISFFVPFFLLKSKDYLKKAIKLFALIIIIYLMFLIVLKNPFLYNLVGYRIETMISGLLGNVTDGSTSFRLKLINWGMEWFKQNPFLGYGLDCFKYLLGTQHITWAGVDGVYAHNNYIELLVDCGIIGTIIYYYIYMYVISKYIKNKNKNIISLFSICIIISMLVLEISQVSYSYVFLQEIIAIAYCFSINNTIKEDGEKNEDC